MFKVRHTFHLINFDPFHRGFVPKESTIGNKVNASQMVEASYKYIALRNLQQQSSCQRRLADAATSTEDKSAFLPRTIDPVLGFCRKVERAETVWRRVSKYTAWVAKPAREDLSQSDL